jgi:hypothetical protein
LCADWLSHLSIIRAISPCAEGRREKIERGISEQERPNPEAEAFCPSREAFHDRLSMKGKGAQILVFGGAAHEPQEN